MVNIIPSSISSQFKSSGVDPSNGPKANTLTVSDKTTLKDLQAFLAQGSASQEVRGHMVGGNLELYTKPANPKDPGGRMQTALNHFVSDSAKQKRDLGKAGIKSIVHQHLGAEKAATSNVTVALDTGIAKSVKAGSMMVLAEIARGQSMGELKPSNRGPSLSETGMSKEQIAHSMGEAAKLIKSGAVDDAVKQLGKDFAKAFEKTGPDANKRDAFALSTGQIFKAEVNELLAAHGVTEPPNPGGRHMSLADKIYAAVGSQVGRANINEAGHLVIGGKTYVDEGSLGKGGGGSINFYVNRDDHSDRLAFKTMLPKGQGRDGMALEQNKMLVEIEKHQQAYSHDPDNVVPMRAGVQLPNGMFGLAMDIAQLGDVEKAIDVLNAAEKKGDLTAAQSMAARLTLIQDSLKGLQSMHDAGNVHRDVKPLNLFIFPGGVVKVADFGDTQSIANYNIYDRGGESGMYLAPERLKQLKEEVVGSQTMKKMDVSSLDSAGRELKAQMPGMSDEMIKKLVRNLKDTIKMDAVSQYADPIKRDAFALGMTAYHIGSGDLPMDDEKAWSASFDVNPNAVLSRDAVNKFSADGIADPVLKSAVQDLIKMADDLTSWDKSKRIDIPEALKSPAFDLAGVGTPETRLRIDSLLKKAKNLGDDYLPLPTPTPKATGTTTPLQRA